jgi:hypothetical protein
MYWSGAEAGKQEYGEEAGNHGMVSGLSVLCWLITP